MKFFFDTEFIEAGRNFPLTLISIGIVDEDGNEFYAESKEFRVAQCNEWVKANVLPHLGPPVERRTCFQIARAIRDFVGTGKPEFWAYYADYDWVVLCQLFGTMMDLPRGWPMYCMDLKQLTVSVGNPGLPLTGKDEHHALADARWNRATYNWLIERHGVG